ncbi:MAG: hypothetical protein K5989_09315 [Lachnospiraceae bacterium]|nr:hypothetical protein [Lachnospiraceae bacterium]
MKVYINKALNNRLFMVLFFLAIITVLIPIFAPYTASHDPRIRLEGKNI